MKPQKIDAIFAWVATEPDGGEGLVATQIEGYLIPLIGADVDRIKSLRPYAEEARLATGAPIRLVRFSAREDLEDLK